MPGPDLDKQSRGRGMTLLATVLYEDTMLPSPGIVQLATACFFIYSFFARPSQASSPISQNAPASRPGSSNKRPMQPTTRPIKTAGSTSRKVKQTHKHLHTSLEKRCRANFKRVCWLHVLEKVRQAMQRSFCKPKRLRSYWNHLEHKQLQHSIQKSRSFREAAQKIDVFLQGLGISHTRFITPDKLMYHFIRSIRQPKSKVWHIGVQYTRRKQQYVIRAVYEGYPADERGFRRGDVILLADGKPFEPVAAFQKGRSVLLTVLRNKRSYQIPIQPVYESLYNSMIRATYNSYKVIKIGRWKFGYVHQWHLLWRGSLEILRGLLLHNLAGQDGLILDLRDGYGGNSYRFRKLFFRLKDFYTPSHFNYRGRIRNFGRAFRLQSELRWYKERLKHSKKYKLDKHDIKRFRRNQKRLQRCLEENPPYTRPMVVLSNYGSRSAKEDLVYQFRKTKRAIVIGERTAGAYTGGRIYFANSKRYILYVGAHTIFIDGTTIEGKGVAPDIVIPYPIDSTLRVDPQRQAALKVMNVLLQNAAKQRTAPSSAPHVPSSKPQGR